MANAAKLAKMFKVLSADARVRIIQLLKRRSLCVTELTGPLGISQEATSQHLKVLRRMGLVKSVKRGFHVYYFLDKQNIGRLDKAMRQLLKQ